MNIPLVWYVSIGVFFFLRLRFSTHNTKLLAPNMNFSQRHMNLIVNLNYFPFFFLTIEITSNCKSDTIVCSNTIQLDLEDIVGNCLFKEVCKLLFLFKACLVVHWIKMFGVRFNFVKVDVVGPHDFTFAISFLWNGRILMSNPLWIF